MQHSLPVGAYDTRVSLMIDSNKIRCDIIKVLDILADAGYYRGKLEIDYDIDSKQFKIDIHEFKREANNLIIRRTTTIR